MLQCDFQEPWDLIAAPPERGVGVWRISSEEIDPRGSVLEGLLSPIERERASAMVHASRRIEFTLGRAALRYVLSRRMGMPPAAVPLFDGPLGKPMIDAPGVAVSVAHSGQVILVALGETLCLGVDVETIRPRRTLDALIERFGGPLECRMLDTLEGPDRLDAFYRVWCRKEACLKATGAGIPYQLDALDTAAAEVTCTGPTGQVCLQLRDLDPGPGYVGALAMPSPVLEISTWAFPLDQLLGLLSRTGGIAGVL